MNALATPEPTALAILDAVIADLTRLGGHGSVEQLHTVRAALVKLGDSLDAQIAADFAERNGWRDRMSAVTARPVCQADSGE